MYVCMYVCIGKDIIYIFLPSLECMTLAYVYIYICSDFCRVCFCVRECVCLCVCVCIDEVDVYVEPAPLMLCSMAAGRNFVSRQRRCRRVRTEYTSPNIIYRHISVYVSAPAAVSSGYRSAHFTQASSLFIPIYWYISVYISVYNGCRLRRCI